MFKIFTSILFLNLLSCQKKNENVILLKQEVVFTIIHFLKENPTDFSQEEYSVNSILTYLNKKCVKSQVKNDIIHSWDFKIIDNKTIQFTGNSMSNYAGIIITESNNEVTTNYNGF